MDKRTTPSTPKDSLHGALYALCRERDLSPTLAARLVSVAKGLSNAEIALASDVSANTIKTELRALFERLGVRSRQEIRGAVQAAARRAAEGAETEELLTFLRLRLER